MSERKTENLLQLLDPPFPILYKGILPEGKHFQMTKSKLSRECCVCERSFSVFFWKINGIPYKTYICSICAKVANVCQVSLLDLDIGVPVIVRNKLIQQHQEDFKSSTRRWYHNRLMDKKIMDGEQWYDSSIREKVLALDPAIVLRARQMVEADPYLSFKKAPVCPEWLDNKCTHGESCYYAHVLPGPGENSPSWTKYGVRCRYLGTLDPNGTAIIEKLVGIDPSFFQKRDEEPEPEQPPEEPKSLKKEEFCPMDLPEESEEIYDFKKPLPFDFIERSGRPMPKLIDGRLVFE